MVKKLIRYLTKKEYRFTVNGSYGFYKKMSDEEYLKKRYQAITGKAINLTNPQTFNEKMQWLKLYDRKPIYSTMVDKYEAKKYVATIIGEEYIVPTLGIWDRVKDMDFSSLPDRFVLKCTHDSGGFIICKNKYSFNKKEAKQKITKWLKRNYYWGEREWPYKNVKPRIIAEEYIVSDESEQVPEYKVFCFNGIAKLILVCQGTAHGSGRTNTFFDRDFNFIPVDSVYKRYSGTIEKPWYYDELIQKAELLSKSMPFLRVDFYCLEKRFYVGELTLYHNAGLCPFNPPEYDLEFGKLLILPEYVKE